MAPDPQLEEIPGTMSTPPESLQLKLFGEGLGVEKVGKKQFSEWGLPGVENVAMPLESLFTLSRAPQRPYVKKSKRIKN